MLKVLVVDDEVIVRVGLKSVIDWEANGFQLIGEASNGVQALDIIKQKLPDIVLTDVKMPLMDGIELIKQTNQLGVPIRFIVLSCHDDFAMVKEAMKLGAEEYFLKLNMETEELLKVLIDMKNKINESKKVQAERSKIERNISLNMPVMRQKFFSDLVFSNIYREHEINEKLRFLNIEMGEKNLFCIVLWVDSFYKFEDYSEKDIKLTNFSIINIIEEILEDFRPGYVFNSKPGEFVLILSTDSICSEKEMQERIFLVTSRIRDLLKKYIDISLSAGTSNVFSKLSNITAAYKEAADAIKYRYFTGAGSIIKPEDVKTIVRNRTMPIQSPKYEELKDLLNNKDLGKMNEFFDDISSYLNNYLVTKENAQLICMSLIMQFITKLRKQEDDMTKILGEEYDCNQEIRKLETLKDISNWIKWLNNKVYMFINLTAKKPSKKIIVNSKKFVNENFHRDISLNEIAGLLNVTPSYFSNLFKQETGECLTDYITSTRIEKAKEYMRTTNMKIYEIAGAVGFQNIYYFSKIFKKVTGVSPMEYREKR